METGFAELAKLLQMHAVFDFTQELKTLPLNKWSRAYEGFDETVVLFCCKDKKFPVIADTFEAFKEFDKHFVARQHIQQSETLLREMLEETMNNSGVRC